MNKKIIIYTGNFNTDQINAAGKRVIANSYLLLKDGYRPVLLGVNTRISDNIRIQKSQREIPGIELFSYPANLFINNRYDYKSFYKCFVEFAKSYNLKLIKCVVLYGCPSIGYLNKMIIDFCHRNNIPVIADVTDWLKSDDANPMKRFIRQLDIDYKNRIVYKRVDGIIAISSFLAKYYEKSSCVITVPPLVYEKNMKKEFCHNTVTQIAYAGSPFKVGNRITNPKYLKDRIDVMIKALAVLKSKCVKFKIHMFGFTKNELVDCLPFIESYVNQLDDSIVFYGKIPMDEVIDKITHMDYTFLIRDNNRVTNSGFSTKIVESITAGTPVITTMTSDISKYLKEGEGVFYLKTNKFSCICSTLKVLINRSIEERISQKQKCSNVKCFYPDMYQDAMKKFIEKISN